MKCSYCGMRNPRKNNFCKECGEELVKVARPAAAPPSTVVVIERGRKRLPLYAQVLIVFAVCVAVGGYLVWTGVLEIGNPHVIHLPPWLYDLIFR